MKFSYRAKSGVDKIVEGVIDAQTHELASEALMKDGLFPLEIINDGAAQKVSPAAKQVKKKRGIFPERITSRQILVLTQKLTTLIRARVGLLPALRIAQEHTDQPALQEIIGKIYASISEGNTFSDALEGFPKVFSPLYINIIRAGETSGALDAALERISEFLDREETLRSKVSVALAYPSILLLMGVGSIFVLINFVVPRLKSIFEGIGSDLPLITRIVLDISELSNKSWWMLGSGLLLFIFIIYSRKGSPFFKRLLRRLRLMIPIVNRITINQELAYISHSLGMLLKSGVPVMKCLSTTIPGVESPVFRKELEGALKKISAGENLFNSLAGVPSLPSFFTRMIAVGEESGRLTEIFDELSHSYTQQIETDINMLSALMEPVLILVLGLIMGTIVMAILIPMFQITSVVQ